MPKFCSSIFKIHVANDAHKLSSIACIAGQRGTTKTTFDPKTKFKLSFEGMHEGPNRLQDNFVIGCNHRLKGQSDRSIM